MITKVELKGHFLLLLAFACCFYMNSEEVNVTAISTSRFKKPKPLNSFDRAKNLLYCIGYQEKYIKIYK